MDFGKIDLFYHRHNFFGNVMEITKQTILFYELTIVLKGTMTYSVNGTEYELLEGSAVFIPYGNERKRTPDTTADYISFNFLSDKRTEVGEPFIPQFVDDEVASLLKNYDLIVANNRGRVKEKCTCLVNALLVKLNDYFSAPKYSALTLSVIKYLENNLHRQITLKEIENAVFFSANYVDKKFKTETGHSIIKYFNLLRLEKAKTLIAEQIYSLEDISDRLGFTDYNYFSRLFKKTFTISPIQYKKQFLLKS